ESGPNGKVAVWDAESKIFLRDLIGHKEGVRIVGFSHTMKNMKGRMLDPKFIVSIGEGCSDVMILWKWKEGIAISVNRMPYIINSISFGHGESTFCTVGNQHAKLWSFTDQVIENNKQVLLSESQYEKQNIWDGNIENEFNPLEGRNFIIGAMRDSNIMDVQYSFGGGNDTKINNNNNNNNNSNNQDNDQLDDIDYQLEDERHMIYMVTNRCILCLLDDQSRRIMKFVRLQPENAKPVSQVSLSVNYSFIAVGCDQQPIQLFCTKTLQHIGTLPMPPPIGTADFASFVRNQQRITSGKEEQEGLNYTEQSTLCLRTIMKDSGASIVVVYSDHSMILWDSQWSQLNEIPLIYQQAVHDHELTSLDYSPAGFGWKKEHKHDKHHKGSKDGQLKQDKDITDKSNRNIDNNAEEMEREGKSPYLLASG
ncbi:MAG: putative mitogen-activated protein kinase-binding protein1, partial [Streblomastix strix]